jgi:hypothetical protein
MIADLADAQLGEQRGVPWEDSQFALVGREGDAIDETIEELPLRRYDD